MKRAVLKAQAERYARRAEPYGADDVARERLLKRALERAERAPLGDAVDDVQTFVRMIRAYSSGRYRDVPTRSIMLMLGTLLYLLNPIDLIPDFIPVLGFADDLAVIAFVLRAVRADIDRFRRWERAASGL